MEIKLDFREIFCDWMVKHTIIFPFTCAPPPLQILFEGLRDGR